MRDDAPDTWDWFETPAPPTVELPEDVEIGRLLGPHGEVLRIVKDRHPIGFMP